MSFREKTAWISMLTTLGIFGAYFWPRFTGPPGWHDRLDGLLWTIVALVVAQIVLNVVAAIISPKEAKAPRDERDKLIELHATRIAYSGLATAVAIACFFGAMNPPLVFNANALLFILVTCEVMRTGSQIIQYRRG